MSGGLKQPNIPPQISHVPIRRGHMKKQCARREKKMPGRLRPSRAKSAVAEKNEQAAAPVKAEPAPASPRTRDFLHGFMSSVVCAQRGMDVHDMEIVTSWRNIVLKTWFKNRLP